VRDDSFSLSLKRGANMRLELVALVKRDKNRDRAIDIGLTANGPVGYHTDGVALRCAVEPPVVV
jgi:hypothetical protein